MYPIQLNKLSALAIYVREVYVVLTICNPSPENAGVSDKNDLKRLTLLYARMKAS
jgi:hypothetical protein